MGKPAGNLYAYNYSSGPVSTLLTHTSSFPCFLKGCFLLQIVSRVYCLTEFKAASSKNKTGNHIEALAL